MINHEFLSFALKYGYRNLLRKKRRSFLLIMTVVLAVMVSLVAYSYAEAIFDYWIVSTIESGPGQAQIVPNARLTEGAVLSPNSTFLNNNKIEAYLKNDPGVKAYSTRLRLDGLVSAGSKSIYFVGVGFDISKELIISPRLINFSGNQGTLLDDPEGEVVAIGKGLAESLGVKLGDQIFLSAYTADENLNAQTARIVAIINFQDDLVSKRIIYFPLGFAQNLVQMPNRYNEIALRLHSEVDLMAWSQHSKNTFVSLGGRLMPWWEIFPPMLKIEKIWQSVVGVIAALLFLLSAISLMTIILLTVGERTREIGVLAALGARRKDIRYLFSIESMMMASLGAVLGLVFFAIYILIVSYTGIPIENPLFSGYIFIFPEFNIFISFLVFIVCLLVCGLSAIVPVVKASGTDPVAAFRGQI